MKLFQATVPVTARILHRLRPQHQQFQLISAVKEADGYTVFPESKEANQSPPEESRVYIYIAYYVPLTNKLAGIHI